MTEIARSDGIVLAAQTALGDLTGTTAIRLEACPDMTDLGTVRGGVHARIGRREATGVNSACDPIEVTGKT